MAKRRMFSIDIVGSDMFMEMPQSAQLLYFHLGMNGDDEGFVSNSKMIALMIGCSEQDFNKLKELNLIHVFENGILVIIDWNISNTLRNDRFKKTIYTEERKTIDLTKDKKYRIK